MVGFTVTCELKIRTSVFRSEVCLPGGLSVYCQGIVRVLSVYSRVLPVFYDHQHYFRVRGLNDCISVFCSCLINATIPVVGGLLLQYIPGVFSSVCNNKSLNMGLSFTRDC